MKKLLLAAGVSVLMLSSCSMHNGLTTNANLNTTQVVLKDNNYKIIQSIQGESEATYIFGIGGLLKNAMIAEAKADMLKSVDLLGKSRAIINENVEIKHTFYPFVTKYKVIVTANVVEFY